MISIKQQNRGVQQDQAQSNDRLSKAAVSPLNTAFEAVLGAQASVDESAEMDLENKAGLPGEQGVGNSLPVNEMQAASIAGVVDLAAARVVQADTFVQADLQGFPAVPSGLGVSVVSKLVGRGSAALQGEGLDKPRLDADRLLQRFADADIDSRQVGPGFAPFSEAVGGQVFDGENVNSVANALDLTSDRAGYKHHNSQEVVEAAEPVDGSMGLGAVLADEKSIGLTREFAGGGDGRLLSDADLHPTRSEKSSRGDSRVAMPGLGSDSTQQVPALNSLIGGGVHEFFGSTLDSMSLVLHGRNETLIGSTISWLTSQKGGVVSLDLSPPDIGHLRMELRLDSVSERATLIVQASTEAAKAAIEQSLDKLRQAFDTSGLDLSVSVQTGLGGWSNQSGNSALSQSNWQNSNVSLPGLGPKDGLEAVHGAQKLSSELSLYV